MCHQGCPSLKYGVHHRLKTILARHQSYVLHPCLPEMPPHYVPCREFVVYQILCVLRWIWPVQEY